MDNRRTLPPQNSLAHLMLTLTALSGEFPTAQIGRLPSTPAYREKVLKSLKNERLLRAYYCDGLRGLRLTTAGKRQLLAAHPERFTSYLSGQVETNMLKSEVTRRLRLHRMAEVLVTMLNAGISVFPWEKTSLFISQPPRSPPSIEYPAYYSSREVKELGEQATKVRGSRSTGLLISERDVFPVYNTGPSVMRWEYQAEMRLKALIQTELCQGRLSSQHREAGSSAIVFGTDMAPMLSFMAHNGGQPYHFLLDGSYRHFYYLTNDHYGEVILQLLCFREERQLLDGILAEDLEPCRPGWVVENDAMDGDSPALFAYTCDLPRIKRFDNALELYSKTGSLFCFDFQEETIRQVCGPRVNIQCIDFDAYERSVFLPEKEPD